MPCSRAPPPLPLYIKMYLRIPKNRFTVLSFFLSPLGLFNVMFYSDPPLDEDDLPEGEWLCHRCTVCPQAPDVSRQ